MWFRQVNSWKKDSSLVKEIRAGAPVQPMYPWKTPHVLPGGDFPQSVKICGKSAKTRGFLSEYQTELGK